MIKESLNNHPLIFSVGINHKTAPLEVRERMAISDQQLPYVLDLFKKELSECMIVSTCNRTELYGVTNGSGLNTDLIKELMLEFNNARPLVSKEHFYEYVLHTAAYQLFKVATSIDSMVVGDSQVMTQVKRSYEIAKEHGCTGKVLNQLVQKALHTAKRVKTETSLFEGAFSISYAAVELSMKIFGDVKDKKALVIGAGETAELTLESLVKKNISKVYITNRTRDNADKLKESMQKYSEFDCDVVGFDSFKDILNDVDIIISSTGSSDYVLSYDEFKSIAKQRRGMPILIIDIAVPRDIDPKIDKLGNVFLKNIDDLNAIIDTNYEKRMSVIPDVNKIISYEVLEFLFWYYTIPVLPAIQYIQSNFNGQAAAEIKNIRNYVVEQVKEFHGNQMLQAGAGNMNELLNKHLELISNLENLNKSKER